MKPQPLGSVSPPIQLNIPTITGSVDQSYDQDKYLDGLIKEFSEVQSDTRILRALLSFLPEAKESLRQSLESQPGLPAQTLKVSLLNFCLQKSQSDKSLFA